MTLFSNLAKWPLRKLFSAVVVAPMLVGTIYYTTIASDRFVSNSVISVRQANQESGAGSLAMVLTGANSTSRDDTLYVRQFVQSSDLLARLDAKLDLRSHFSEGGGIDMPFKLASDANREDVLDYFRRMVGVKFDEAGAILSIQAQGFTPEFARALNAELLVEAEAFVNHFSQKTAKEQLVFAQAEMLGAAERLQKAKSRLITFQAENNILDPTSQAQASGALVAEMQASLTRAESELKVALTFLQEDASQVRTLRGQVEALRSQLNVEQLRPTQGKASKRLTVLASSFQELTLAVAFAQDAYKLALTAVETARIDGLRKAKSLAVIEPPTLPDSAIYPRKLYNLLTVLLLCLVVYGIACMVIETIKEHRD